MGTVSNIVPSWVELLRDPKEHEQSLTIKEYQPSDFKKRLDYNKILIIFYTFFL